MRLLHVDKLKVEEFNNDKDRPPYAILSHTWGDGEVSFQNIQTPKAASMAGYTKILKCCEIAKRDGFEYVWIDTCCIDKTSSAELSEAINSMFNWYRVADVCYVYLSDVTQDDKDPHDIKSNFRTCRWFTRGWTLQELLAPEVIVFYNRDWVDIGTKRTLQETISEITGIPYEALLKAAHIREVSIAARMSWASRRYTTRVEDRAYSLMGIFDVNMPPLYGEGDKAFRRLQLEIIKESRDESIFAWSETPIDACGTRIPGSFRSRCDLWANSPGDFEHCHGVICNVRNQSKLPFSSSNKGLHIWLPSIRTTNGRGKDLLLAGLNCMLADRKQIFITLELQSANSGEYIRWNSRGYTVETDDLHTMDHPTELYIIGQDLTGSDVFPSRYPPESLTSMFYFVENTSPETGYHIDSFFQAGKRGSRTDVPLDRTFVFDKIHYSDDGYLDLMYFVVTSIQNLSVQATIALGTIHNSISSKHQYLETTYQCRVFSGSNFLSHTGFDNCTSFKELEELYSEIFSGSGNKKFQYFPNDKIVRSLPGGYVITMSARTGPMTKSYTGIGKLDSLPDRFCYQYRVDIAFNRPSYLSGEILEADIVPNNASVKTPEVHISRRTRR